MDESVVLHLPKSEVLHLTTFLVTCLTLTTAESALQLHKSGAIQLSNTFLATCLVRQMLHSATLEKLLISRNIVLNHRHSTRSTLQSLRTSSSFNSVGRQVVFERKTQSLVKLFCSLENCIGAVVVGEFKM